MRTTIIFIALLGGCVASGEDLAPPYESGLAPEATLASLTHEERVALCEGWSAYVLELVGQSTLDALAEEQQALNATTSPAQCREQLPAYASFRPYPAFSSSCDEIASVAAGCTGATVGQLERAAPYLAAYTIDLEAHLSCDLASDGIGGAEARDAPVVERWETRFTPELRAAIECFVAGPDS